LKIFPGDCTGTQTNVFLTIELLYSLTMKKINTVTSQQNLLRLTFVFSAAALIFACQKEAVTKPVYFTDTEYKVLAPYDSATGRPHSMLKDNVSSDMIAYIDKMLPEKQDLRKTNPELLNSNTTVDLSITRKSNVFITYVNTITAFRNTIGFYTYPTSTPPKSPKDIKTITYVFPHAGVGTKLAAGDKLKLGTFEAGTSIGLVLLRDAFNTTNGSINNKAVHFCYNDILNPEVDPKLKKHVVLLPYQPENKILIGFENTDRTTQECDHDFNDLVLYATVE
jgi:hypothetical protein